MKVSSIVLAKKSKYCETLQSSGWMTQLKLKVIKVDITYRDNYNFFVSQWKFQANSIITWHRYTTVWHIGNKLIDSHPILFIVQLCLLISTIHYRNFPNFPVIWSDILSGRFHYSQPCMVFAWYIRQ